MPSQEVADPRRRLPSIDRLLASPDVQRLIELYGRPLVTVQAQRTLQALRDAGASDPEAVESALGDLPARLAAGIVEALGPPLLRVLNATGILLHTNLGRAPLPTDLAAALPALLDASCDLEIDLASGRRGERNGRAEHLLRLLTGAPAALVANNNAAVLVLVIATFAAGREVIVSRGELVEIGGSFRIPDILAAAGGRLVEVGTTNRTTLADYARAIGERTGLLLKVHPSNYRIEGFTTSAAVEELAGLAARHRLPLLVDEGAGLLRAREEPQLREHRAMRELLAAGAPLVCGSGDKLLGGPQAGLLLGAAALVERCRRHPLYRALRPSRMTLAALELVLRRHAVEERLPLDALWPQAEAHHRRLEQVAAQIGAELVPANAFVGGGAAPEEPIPGEALALAGGEPLLRALRTGEPPVVGYVRDDRLLLDLRTVAVADDELLVAAVHRAREVAAAAGATA